MGIAKTLGRLAWRFYVTDGVPSSGANRPLKSDVLAFVDAVDNAIDGVYEHTAGSSLQLTSSHHNVAINKASGSPTTVVLPVSPTVGQEILIFDGKGDAGTNPVTITADAINGGTSTVISVDYGAVRLRRVTNKWIIT